MGFLTMEQAAKRVGKTERTIRNWIRAGQITHRAGYIREDDLLEADRVMRSRRGRPQKVAVDVHTCPPGELIWKLDGGRGAMLCPTCRTIVGYWRPGYFGSRVLADVAGERARQDAKWGEQNHPDGTGYPNGFLSSEGDFEPFDAIAADRVRIRTQENFAAGDGTWADVLLEEVWEALAEVDPAKLRTELIQVAAVATAWVEAIDRRAA